MLRLLASLGTVYTWADRWLTADYVLSRYVRGKPQYDVAFESYVYSWWAYLAQWES